MALPDSLVSRLCRWRRLLPEALAVGLCLIALLAAAWVATAVFDRVPHVEDELAYLFQARTIASGRLLADAPAQPEFFDAPFLLIRDGKWFGKYTPGYPMVLALGARVGQPWLVNPVFGALSVGLVYLAGRRLYGAPTGLLAAALMTISPFFLLQSGSWMSHVVCLFWALLFLLLFEMASRGSEVAALFAGMALGILFLSRPLTAVAIAVPYTLWAGIDILRSPRRLPPYLPVLMGFLPFGASLPAYNYLTTGDPLRSAYELYWPFDKVGFGPGAGPDGGHTLAIGWLTTRQNLELLANYLFGWPGRLSLAPAALAAALAVLRLVWRALRERGIDTPGQSNARLTDPVTPRSPPASGSPVRAPRFPEAWDLLHIGVAASLVAAYVAYWHGLPMYGPRYYFEALGALVLLSARGLLQVAALSAALLGRAVPALPRPRVWVTAAMLAVVAGLTAHSFTHFAPQEFRRHVRWYTIDGSGVRLVRAAKLQNAVVFVTRVKQPEYAWLDYAPFFSQNVPSLDSDVVYAIDLGDDHNRTLMARYPGRAFYRYKEGTLT
ncbi:MAG TPA: glycosyltransferase family 39 protein, partial [Chloroflexota bacterium]|nr:glycosyltransferase family 39 protein [Chloroflexota bacterium]